MGENGKITSQIEEKEKEAVKLIIEVNKIGREEEVIGTMSTEVRIMMYEKTVVPGIDL